MMGLELIAFLVSVLLGGLFPLSKTIAEKYLKYSLKTGKKGKEQEFIAKLFGVKLEETTSYRERLSNTLDLLKKAFAEVDRATIEFTNLMKEKEKNIDALESRLSELSKEESDLKNKVETLQKVPIEALTHFEAILNKGDKRSAFRDYLLFGLGVLVSIIVTLILKLYFEI